MDRLLTPGVEKEEVWSKIEKLINIYYDALDASKTGKKVCFFLWVILGNALGCRRVMMPEQYNMNLLITLDSGFNRTHLAYLKIL